MSLRTILAISALQLALLLASAGAAPMRPAPRGSRQTSASGDGERERSPMEAEREAFEKLRSGLGAMHRFTSHPVYVLCQLSWEHGALPSDDSNDETAVVKFLLEQHITEAYTVLKNFDQLKHVSSSEEYPENTDYTGIADFVCPDIEKTLNSPLMDIEQKLKVYSHDVRNDTHYNGHDTSCHPGTKFNDKISNFTWFTNGSIDWIKERYDTLQEQASQQSLIRDLFDISS